nr:MAG TPA_asm: hypothetical protein [Caudoviricetes sp.]
MLTPPPQPTQLRGGLPRHTKKPRRITRQGFNISS